MTIERRLARAGFTLTRDYPVPLKRVWDAFAEEDQKRGWYGAGDTIEPGEWALDFRVGGRDVDEGTFHDGLVSRYEATYTNTLKHVRIIPTYNMWLDGDHMSTSVATLEFEPLNAGTRFTHVEHGVFFDQFWADGPGRKEGTRGLLEALGNYLADAPHALRTGVPAAHTIPLESRRRLTKMEESLEVLVTHKSTTTAAATTFSPVNRSTSSVGSSTSRTLKASCGCARSAPSWSDSRTITSRGEHALSEASCQRSTCLPGSAPITLGFIDKVPHDISFDDLTSCPRS